jgi:hypothetical protein
MTLPTVRLLPAARAFKRLKFGGWRRRFATMLIVNGSEHRVVVRSRLGNWPNNIPVLDHLPVFGPVNVNDGFAVRTVRQAVPMAVEDDVVPVEKTRLTSPCAPGRSAFIQATNLRSPSMPSSMSGLCWR